MGFLHSGLVIQRLRSERCLMEKEGGKRIGDGNGYSAVCMYIFPGQLFCVLTSFPECKKCLRQCKSLLRRATAGEDQYPEKQME